MQALSKAAVQSWALSGPADAVTSTRGHSSCQWSVRQRYIFVTFTDFLSLTNCAIQIPGSKVMVPDRGANTALSSSLKGFAQEV